MLSILSIAVSIVTTGTHSLRINFIRVNLSPIIFIFRFDAIR